LCAILHGPRLCVESQSFSDFRQVHLDKRAETIFGDYVRACDMFDVPSRVRFDQGSEGVLIGKVQTQYWDWRGLGSDRGSFITGRSVHNTRIEGMWNFLGRTVGRAFRALFDAMERIGCFDATNAGHFFVLHSVFLRRIQGALGVCYF